MSAVFNVRVNLVSRMVKLAMLSKIKKENNYKGNRYLIYNSSIKIKITIKIKAINYKIM